MMIGSSLGHYTIVQKLGSGGMGDVYLAHDSTLGRDVALKILPPEVAGDPERRARFEREARAIAALSHPNIVTVHSIERDGDAHFITMEYVSGRTLSACIPAKGLPLKQFFQIALPLVEAVSAAHQQAVTHRDLKPDNVMVSEDNRVKVLDFGLAKMKAGFVDGETDTAAPASHARTMAGQILGTIAYMSPEQAEGHRVDYRSDIFSLGIILHEMITGQRPFDGGSNASIVSSILRDAAPPITDLNPALPTSLAKIIQRCLAKDPSRRYQSALDLRNELDEVRGEFESGTSVSVAAATRTRSYTTRALIALALVGVIGVVVWLRTGREVSSESASIGEATFNQLTHELGQELFPSLSPDGRMIVFASAANGNLDLYARRVGGENAINLTKDSPADDSQPAFSPDGDRIVFRSERDGGGLFVMGATGESVRRVTDLGYHPAWSPDGQQVVYVTQSVNDPGFRFTTSQLWVVTTTTGEKRLLSEGDAAQPSWSPNGYRIAYWGRTTGTGPGDIWTIPATGGQPVAVTTEPSTDWNPVWGPDGRHLYFQAIVAAA